ncbi:MAG: GatB/YqeY domain-containing protein [Burkholderiaceae bacterium]
MSLKATINEDMKAAMRARDAARLSTVRLLLAAIKQREIDERIELDDGQIHGVVERLIKQRRDAIEQFGRAGRQDLVAKEEAEVVVLLGYLPAQAAPEEIADAITAAIVSVGAQSMRDMGRVMGVLKGKLAGRADMAAVSTQVAAQLKERSGA